MLNLAEQYVSEDGTVKFLSALSDGNLIETVIMSHDYGNSVCVTSQAGCSMGCRFCASGLSGKIRDLTAEEILVQAQMADRYLLSKEDESRKGQPEFQQNQKESGLTHVVVMGTGEPFENYEEVIRFCDMVSDEKALKSHPDADGRILKAIAPRHITVSTCGIIPKIAAFAETKKRYNLAISLHAPDDEIRSRLMPINRKYGIVELIRAAGDYSRKTGRRVTLEYILLDGINDSPDCAEKLALLLKDNKTGFYVNLIPYNSVREFGFRGTEKTKALQFYDILMKNGIRATLRKERGTDIAAACGQLRAARQGQGERNG